MTEGSTTTIQWYGVVDDYVCSEVRYTDKNNEEQIVRALPNQTSTMISDAKAGSTYEHRSLYVPANCIDTFYTEWIYVDEILIRYPRDTWTAESRNGNHPWDSYGGQPEKVLDGDRNTGWHSRVDAPLPQCLVVDMK